MDMASFLSIDSVCGLGKLLTSSRGSGLLKRRCYLACSWFYVVKCYTSTGG